MKERVQENINHVIQRSLEAVVRPWAKLPKQDLVGQVESLAVPVIEIARRAGVSVQRAIAERPDRISVDGQGFFYGKP